MASTAYDDPNPGMPDDVATEQPAAVLSPTVRPRVALAAIVAIGLVLLGAWGAIAPYAGPSFKYGPQGAVSWQWTTAHAVLNLIPGAAAVFAGLVVLVTVGSVRRRAAQGFAGLLVMLAGAWFILGPLAYPVLYSGGDPYASTAGQSALAQLTVRLGYSLGVGICLCLLAGVLMAMSPFKVRRPVLAEPQHRRIFGRHHPVAMDR
jgi:hypothetical protein